MSHISVRFAPTVTAGIAEHFDDVANPCTPVSRRATEADVLALRTAAPGYTPVRRQGWNPDAETRHAVGLARGLYGTELLAAELACAEEGTYDDGHPYGGMPLDAARALARRMVSASFWFTRSDAGRRIKSVWPTLSARDLAEAPCSFEAFARTWEMCADSGELAGSSRQSFGQETIRIVGQIAGEVYGRGLPKWAARALACIVSVSPRGSRPRTPSMPELRGIHAGALFFRRAGASRWATPTVRILRTLGRLSPAARRVYLDGLAEAPARRPLDCRVMPGFRLNWRSEMQPHQQRVVDEKAELGAFKNTDVFASLPWQEQERLNTQAHIMTMYSAVLGERIAAFNA